MHRPAKHRREPRMLATLLGGVPPLLGNSRADVYTSIVVYHGGPHDLRRYTLDKLYHGLQITHAYMTGLRLLSSPQAPPPCVHTA